MNQVHIPGSATPQFWRRHAGFLPVPLEPGSGPTTSYVLLNGARGNFCLQTAPSASDQEPRATAWSSYVDFHGTVRGDTLELVRWDQPHGFSEQIKLALIEQQLDRFLNYLQSETPSSAAGVVSHTMDVLRVFRSTLFRQTQESSSLDAFLVLLASAAESHCDPARVDPRRWGLEPRGIELARTLTGSQWEQLVSMLTKSRGHEALTMHVPFVLRHAAGSLFQEAHYLLEEPLLPGELFPDSIGAPARYAATRNSAGVYFTPPSIARTVVEEALASLVPLPAALTVFDPACGSGEFLREVLRQLELTGYRGSVKAIGWDISADAAAMTRFVLAWEGQSLIPKGIALDIEISQRDSLHPDAPWPNDVGLLVMNPPFRSWEGMTRDGRANVFAVLADLPGSKRGRADLAAAFLWRGLKTLGPRAAIGTVVPASFLDGQAQAPLRQALAERLSIHLLARLGNQRLFARATVDAALIVGSNASGSERPLMAWSDHRAPSSSAVLRALRRMRAPDSLAPSTSDGEGFSIYPVERKVLEASAWRVRPKRAYEQAAHLRAQHPTVAELFDVRQGAKTGSNAAFLLSRRVWQELPAKERVFFRPAVINDSLWAGSLTESHYVFFPNDAEFSISTGAELERRVPVYLKRFLQPHKAHLEKAAAAVGDTPWWQLRWDRVWQRARVPKLVSTSFGHAGSFAYDARGHFVVVQGHAWLPKAQSLAKRPRRGGAALSPALGHAYCAILASELFDALLASAAVQVQGGQWTLSAPNVGSIPLPDLFDATATDPDLLLELTSLGRRLAASKDLDVDLLNQLARRAYRID